MKSFICEYDLQQIVTEPTRGNNLLDAAIVSSQLNKAIADVLPPVAGADYEAQKLIIPLNVPLCYTIPNVTKVDINTLSVYLKTIDWNYIFAGCTDVDPYVQQFNEVMQSAYEVYKFTVVFHKRENHPRDILHLIHIKKHTWRDAVRTEYKDNYRIVCKHVRQSIREYHVQQINKLLKRKNSKYFDASINARLGSCNKNNIVLGDGSLTNKETADILSREFTNNLKK